MTANAFAISRAFITKISVFLLCLSLAGCQSSSSSISSVNDARKGGGDLVRSTVRDFHMEEIVQFEPTIASLESATEPWGRLLCRNEEIMKKIIIPVSDEIVQEGLQYKGSGYVVLVATMFPDMACTRKFDDVDRADKALEVYDTLLADKELFKKDVYRFMAEEFSK